MARKTYQGPPEKLELYEKLLATIPEIVRKGAANPYTSHNGNMFTFLDRTGAVSLRMGKEEREDFLERFDTQLSFQYNTVMKEYVLVPDDLLLNTKKAKQYLEVSWAYVQSLKAKPTKKRKS